MLLAGDVGGTKTLLGVFGRAPGRPAAISVCAYATGEFDSFGAIVERFLNRPGGASVEIETACFGVAGPVRDQRAELTNIPWGIDAAGLTSQFGFARVHLLNDLEAVGYAIPLLAHDEMTVLQQGARTATGNAAVIAAGTGLGEVFLHRLGPRFVPLPSEGGHADFAPRTAREFELARHLIARFGRASLEQVVSGPGLVNLHAFTHPGACPAVPDSVDAGSLPAVVSEAALERRCPHCAEALELFVGAYGSEAGNLALRGVATGGLFVAGGIAPKILPALQGGNFLEAFRHKPPMEALLASIRVTVISKPDAGLLGAAVYASHVVSSSK